jgi:hypothetical protein
MSAGEASLLRAPDVADGGREVRAAGMRNSRSRRARKRETDPAVQTTPIGCFLKVSRGVLDNVEGRTDLNR